MSTRKKATPPTELTADLGVNEAPIEDRSYRPPTPAREKWTVRGQPIPSQVEHLITYAQTDQGIAEHNRKPGVSAVRASVVSGEWEKMLEQRSDATEPWMGVDPLGRDIFSRILMGARLSLAAGFISVALGGLVGATLGLLAGYYGGWWERIVMRICDVLLAFPGILLALGVVAILGSSMVNVVVAVSVFSVPAFARLVRGNTLVLKQMTYIEAVRSIGASDWTILVRHILPGSISAIVVYLTMRLGTSIITAASLSFLGLGAQPPTPEWGAMLNEARADMVNAPHVALFPGLAIFLTVLAFNLLGDGLRDALDPKIDRL
ncbi:MAG: hypothetical protein NVS2B4_14500 [Ramlibacter sp.]